MKLVGNHKPIWIVTTGLLLILGTLAVSVLEAQAQKSPPVQNAAAQTTDNQALADQIQQLQQQVAILQAIIQKQNTQRRGGAMGSSRKMGGGKMAMDDDMNQMGGMSSGGSGGMGMMGQEGEMAGFSSEGMSSGGSGGMGMDRGMMGEGGMGGISAEKEMGMCCMGEMGGMREGMRRSGMGAMRSSSTMPGQPGASHLYHIGSTGFFLDHATHIALTSEQKRALNRLKEKALLDRTTQQRRIDQAEQELYMLTGADQPDTTQIQAKIAEIEKLRTDQRMTFIRAVGEATNILTHDQHQALLGTMTSNQK